MTISKTDRAEYALFMHALADKADAIARRYFGLLSDVQFKADASPVTIADQEIEMTLVEAIRQHYPDHGIYGEETSRIKPNASLQWVIDPIDGTRAFIDERDTFVTLIALCEWHPPLNLPPQGGEDEHRESEGGDWWPVLGLISQPIRKQRWMGGDATTPCRHSRESGNLVDKDPRFRGDDIQLKNCTLATTSLHYFTDAERAWFEALSAKCQDTLYNLDGYAAGLLADGEVDILIEAGLKPYDFCALVPVIESAGGVVTDWAGEALTMVSYGHVVAAGNKMLHKKAMELLNERS